MLYLVIIINVTLIMANKCHRKFRKADILSISPSSEQLLVFMEGGKPENPEKTP